MTTWSTGHTLVNVPLMSGSLLKGNLINWKISYTRGLFSRLGEIDQGVVKQRLL